MAKKPNPSRSRGVGNRRPRRQAVAERRFRRRQPGWSRRRALKTLVVAAVAPAVPLCGALGGHEHSESVAAKPEPYRPLFFTPAEFAAITAVAGRIIPSDGTPGAREAKVSEYVDWVVSEDAGLQPVHREGIRWLDRVAKRKYGAAYARLAPARQDAILRLLDSARQVSAENEAAVKFWKSIRRLTLDGFYSSKMGLKELGYQGNTYLLEFKGCTHPEHRA